MGVYLSQMGSLYRFARNRAWDSAQMFLRNLDARHFVYSVQSTALRLWVMSCLVGQWKWCFLASPAFLDPLVLIFGCFGGCKDEQAR
jgi:hypothetical protein